MFTFVAATILTLVFLTSFEPTRMYSPVSSTLNSLACVANGSSPTSSRKSVPLLAAPKYPSRSPIAPVKAPFSCPNSSLSIVPSGMLPQFMAKNLLCLRAELSCIILGITSLPTPLSPTINTDKSIGATCMAIWSALLRAGEFPTTPYLNFIFCKMSLSMLYLLV